MTEAGRPTRRSSLRPRGRRLTHGRLPVDARRHTGGRPGAAIRGAGRSAPEYAAWCVGWRSPLFSALWGVSSSCRTRDALHGRGPSGHPFRNRRRRHCDRNPSPARRLLGYTDSQRTSYWPAYHYGLWLYAAWPILLPHYLVHTRGLRAWRLLLPLYLALMAPVVGGAIGESFSPGTERQIWLE